MYATLLIVHLLGLVLGLGGALGARLTGDYGRKNPEFALFPLVQQFARLNAVGLLLLLVTGVWMSVKMGADLSIATYQIKLVFVVILVGLSGKIHMNIARFKREKDPVILQKNRTLQTIAIGVTLLIVGFATVTFY